ncbi:hypothetical protein [Caballeronia novacaledonica]|uniref:3-oxoacyl-(Acyl carrier protein) synthase n=1 Tax=Caballeronia novacaledonica TaxID=1544861 RepID=A0AA37IHN3_9BURK|nr:hypothetical protein [Caballeronia novacaledonica]GJH29935.1 hypothetical protein CBA19CS42_35485 [Caballeronia novacaledonica]
MNPIFVSCPGMCTAAGFNASASCAAMMAGISGVKEANLWDWESGSLINAARVELPQWWFGVPTLATLAASAIDESMKRARVADPEAVPVLLCIAEPSRPGRLDTIEADMFDELQARLGHALHPLSRLVALGQAGGVVALEHARAILADGSAPHCMVAGVDSYLDQTTLDVFMQRRRVMTPANSNGFIPGEASAAVLLSASENGPSLQVMGLGTGHETATIDSDEPLQGKGLEQVIRRALSDAGIEIYDTQYRMTDLNGEHYKFKESTLVQPRLLHRSHEALFDLWHPIEWLGEIGAAIVPCALGLQLYASTRDMAPGPTCLGFFGTDSGERGAYVARYSGGV